MNSRNPLFWIFGSISVICVLGVGVTLVKVAERSVNLEQQKSLANSIQNKDIETTISRNNKQAYPNPKIIKREFGFGGGKCVQYPQTLLTLTIEHNSPQVKGLRVQSIVCFWISDSERRSFRLEEPDKRFDLNN